MTQLKRNSRKRLDKNSGNKKPRANDFDISIINPAPDSSFYIDQPSTDGLDDHVAMETSLRADENLDRMPTILQVSSTPKRSGILSGMKKKHLDFKNNLSKVKVTFSTAGNTRDSPHSLTRASVPDEQPLGPNNH